MVERKLKIDGVLNGVVDVSGTDGRTKLFCITRETVNIFIEGLNLIKTKNSLKKNQIRWSLDLLEQFKKELES